MNELKTAAEETIAVIMSALGVTLSMTEIGQALDIVSRILSIIISLATVALLVYAKVKKAKADDGEIDAEEAEDIANTLIDGLGDIKDDLNEQDTDKKEGE